MKYAGLQKHLTTKLTSLKQAGLYKPEQIFTSRQGPTISSEKQADMINLASCNYLGYAQDPRLAERAKQLIDEFGVGLSSVRFICGTTEHHIELEKNIAQFYNKDDAILFCNGYSANMAIFETFFVKEDAIIIAKRSHESLKEAADLTRAQRYTFPLQDMNELESQLKAADSNGARFKIIAFDGISSATGDIAPISDICDLADRYDAIVMSDECHSFGVLGENGRGACEVQNALDRVDIVSGTFSKALPGCNGGFLTGQKDIIDMLRQKGRPYLFSNTIPQFAAGTYSYALQLFQQEPQHRHRVIANANNIRDYLQDRGIIFTGYSDSPIVAIPVGDEVATQKAASDILGKGVLVGTCMYPYAEKGNAALRLQVSSMHTKEQLRKGVDIISEVLNRRAK